MDLLKKIGHENLCSDGGDQQTHHCVQHTESAAKRVGPGGQQAALRVSIQAGNQHGDSKAGANAEQIPQQVTAEAGCRNSQHRSDQADNQSVGWACATGGGGEAVVQLSDHNDRQQADYRQ
ncbi:hypothetical protein D3C77_614390 [compost metagenome]